MDANSYYSTDTTTVLTPDQMVALAGMMMFILVVAVLVSAVAVVANWRIYSKAGQPGWATLVPFYNVVILLRILGRPVWWLLLLFVPFVNFVIGIMLSYELGRVYGKSTSFNIIAMVLFPIVGYLVLAFGKATYHPELAAGGAAPQAPAGPQAPTPQQMPPSAPQAPANPV